MFGLLKRYRFALLLIGFLLVAGGLIATGRRGDADTTGSPSAMRSVGAGAAHGATRGVGNWWSRYLDLVDVREDNDRLRQELARVREEHTRLLGVMQENARLRSMIGFAEAHPNLELVPARVVAKPVSSFFRVLSIQLELQDRRVAVGMPVVSSAGVVGHVSGVNGRFVDVMLAIDPRSSIDVVVQHNRARGVLRGSSDESYNTSISYLMRRDQVDVGDIVVTSGLGGRYPADLLVGRIVTIQRRTHGLFQEVVVEPAVDFSRVQEVYVIVGAH